MYKITQWITAGNDGGGNKSGSDDERVPNPKAEAPFTCDELVLLQKCSNDCQLHARGVRFTNRPVVFTDRGI